MINDLADILYHLWLVVAFDCYIVEIYDHNIIRSHRHQYVDNSTYTRIKHHFMAAILILWPIKVTMVKC